MSSPHDPRPPGSSLSAPLDIGSLARTRELHDSDLIPDSTYATIVLNEIALHATAARLLRASSAHDRLALLDALRQAERNSAGYTRHLYGYAAANLDAASWIGTDTEEGRVRLAAALDYLLRATDEAGREARTRTSHGTGTVSFGSPALRGRCWIVYVAVGGLLAVLDVGRDA
ncbi:hypothetical protein [Streptomyces sp. NPDC059893]|uniref:hypothetical protein n=1 Tax=Streptomyces sp. NPDC059893 TaxID=3346990 RepID=UPI00365F7E4D